MQPTEQEIKLYFNAFGKLFLPYAAFGENEGNTYLDALRILARKEGRDSKGWSK